MPWCRCRIGTEASLNSLSMKLGDQIGITIGRIGTRSNRVVAEEVTSA